MSTEDFRANLAAAIKSVARSGKPLQVTKHGKPYATVVSPELWKRAEAALVREEEARRQEEPMAA